MDVFGLGIRNRFRMKMSRAIWLERVDEADSPIAIRKNDGGAERRPPEIQDGNDGTQEKSITTNRVEAEKFLDLIAGKPGERFMFRVIAERRTSKPN